MDNQEVIKVINEDVSLFKDLDSDLKNDEGVSMAAVNHSGSILKYVSENLRNNEEIVMAAIKNDPNAFQYASERLRGKKEVVMLAVSKLGKNLSYVPEELNKDHDVLVMAASNDWHIFQILPTEMKKDERLLHQLQSQKEKIFNSGKKADILMILTMDEIEFTNQEIDRFVKSGDSSYRIAVANRSEFLPTKEQFTIGFFDQDKKVNEIYKSRLEEWNSKYENNYLVGFMKNK